MCASCEKSPKEYLKWFKEKTKEILESKEKMQEFMDETGFYTSNKKISKHYK